MSSGKSLPFSAHHHWPTACVPAPSLELKLRAGYPGILSARQPQMKRALWRAPVEISKCCCGCKTSPLNRLAFERALTAHDIWKTHKVTHPPHPLPPHTHSSTLAQHVPPAAAAAVCIAYPANDIDSGNSSSGSSSGNPGRAIDACSNPQKGQPKGGWSEVVNTPVTSGSVTTGSGHA